MSSPLRDEDIRLIEAYADGELDAAAMLALERRFGSEPELRARYESVLALRRLVKSVSDDDVPIERLRAKATSAIDQSAARRLSWRALAAAALIGAVLSGAGVGGGVLFALRENQATEVARFAVANHARSLLAAQPFDVASSDRHTIKPWFTTKLPESPPVIDLSASGFTLAGGRVDVIGENPVATTVYRHGPHAISLMTLRGAQNVSAGNISGYNVKTWRDGEFTYVAVSDLPEDVLENFRQAFIAGTKN